MTPQEKTTPTNNFVHHRGQWSLGSFEEATGGNLFAL